MHWKRRQVASWYDHLHHFDEASRNGRPATRTATESDARTAVGRLALIAAAAALKMSAPVPVAETFARTRLAEPGVRLFGTAMIDDATRELLLQRVLPEH